MADSTEPTSVPRSRRAVLVGALTGLGISIGQAVVRPLAARAAGKLKVRITSTLFATRSLASFGSCSE